MEFEPSEIVGLVAELLNVTQDKLNESTGVGDIEEWDSLAHTRVILALEERFDIMIDVEDAIDLETIEDIVAYLKEEHS